MNTVRMFVVLRFGDGREELLNPDCSAVNLLEYIKKVIDWDRHGVLDLCDSRGQPRLLHRQGNKNAVACLTPTDIFFPVLLHYKDVLGMSTSHYQLLLSCDDKFHAQIRAQLNRIESAVKKFRKQREGISPSMCVARVVTGMTQSPPSMRRSPANLLTTPKTNSELRKKSSGSSRTVSK